jgi:hypothetical protein
MFGPQHLKHVIEYFDGVDDALSQRLLRKHPPDEPALTNELCALLDADTQQNEDRLAYDIEDLNRALAKCGDGLDFEFTLDTYPHNTAMERYVSQSDFGLVLEYDNRVLPDENWSAAYLVQAKRAFRDPRSGAYDQKSKFQAVNAEQQDRINRLVNILGPYSLLYCLYCPPIRELADVARTQVRAMHTRNLAGQIFDYANGLALRDKLTETDGRIDAGIWFTPVSTSPTRLVALHSNAFRSALPLTWFIVEHFNPGRTFGAGHLDGFWFDNIFADNREPPDPRVKDIVMGEDAAIRELLGELAKSGEEGEAPNRITVLPRHTITIKVSVGRTLPPDEAPGFTD